MYLLQSKMTFNKNMFVHPRWIMTNDYKWSSGSIYQPCVDNGSKHVEMIRIPIDMNGVQPYVPFIMSVLHIQYLFLDIYNGQIGCGFIKTYYIKPIIPHLSTFWNVHTNEMRRFGGAPIIRCITTKILTKD
jgi:hypothetical protein